MGIDSGRIIYVKSIPCVAMNVASDGDSVAGAEPTY
jgi:hypothetical protein